MTRPQVAVVVSCSDLGRTLDDTLRSVHSQTLGPADVVVVDHGSTDVFTRQVLARFEGMGQRILHAPTGGVSTALNLAVRATAAPYVVLVDADTILDKTLLETAAACLERQQDVAFVTCGTAGADGVIETSPVPTPDLIRLIARADIPICVMFRRDMWQAVGGFDERCQGHETLDFWATVLGRGFAGAIVRGALVQHVGTRSVAMGREHSITLEAFYRKHMDLVSRHSEPLLLEKERFILEQREVQERLYDRRGTVEAEIKRLQAEIDEMTGEIEALGHAPVELGDLRRTSPISPIWGLDRGMPLDRYYIASFLDCHRSDIRGRVLEVKDPGYTREFGDDRVTASDVLDIDSQNDRATVVADLTHAREIADDTYDCFILTQVLGLIYDVPAALAHVYRVLKPGGVLLCTVPAAGRISYEGAGLDGDYWRFTEASVRRLFSEAFPIDAFEVTGYGNVLAAAGFLYGLAPQELTRDELNATDPFFPVVYGIRARKPIRSAGDATTSGTHAARRPSRSEPPAAAILLYHRVADHPSETMCVQRVNFRAHMQHLKSDGYNVLPLRELARRLRNGDRLDRSVAITFDDGYVDASTCADDILSEHAFPATFFVVGDALDRPHEFWWDTLQRVFNSGRLLPPALGVQLPAERLDLDTSTHQERSLARARLLKALGPLPRSDREDLVQYVVNWSGIDPGPVHDVRPMTSSELARLAAVPGIEIGSHTQSHAWLPAETREVRVAEVGASKARLEALLGRRVTSFAYPYGGYDPATVQLVKEAGYDQAVTTEERTVGEHANVFLLPRCEIPNGDGSMFSARLRRLFDRHAFTDRPIHKETTEHTEPQTPR